MRFANLLAITSKGRLKNQTICLIQIQIRVSLILHKARLAMIHPGTVQQQFQCTLGHLLILLQQIEMQKFQDYKDIQWTMVLQIQLEWLLWILLEMWPVQ